MPLYRTICISPETVLSLWKITETSDWFWNKTNLGTTSQERMQNTKSEKHRQGFLSVRLLLEKQGYCDGDLWYNPQGKPFLKDGKYISISHSSQFSGILISDKKVGLDIERIRPTIRHIAPKFINPLEANWLKKYPANADTDRILTRIWCAKEAAYKIDGTSSLHFAKQMQVHAPNFVSNTMQLSVQSSPKQVQYSLQFIEFLDHICAYIVA